MAASNSLPYSFTLTKNQLLEIYPPKKYEADDGEDGALARRNQDIQETLGGHIALMITEGYKQLPWVFMNSAAFQNYRRYVHDLVMNSTRAGAENIKFTFDIKKDRAQVLVEDDGGVKLDAFDKTISDAKQLSAIKQSLTDKTLIDWKVIAGVNATAKIKSQHADSKTGGGRGNALTFISRLVGRKKLGGNGKVEIGNRANAKGAIVVITSDLGAHQDPDLPTPTPSPAGNKPLMRLPKLAAASAAMAPHVPAGADANALPAAGSADDFEIASAFSSCESAPSQMKPPVLTASNTEAAMANRLAVKTDGLCIYAPNAADGASPAIPTVAVSSAKPSPAVSNSGTPLKPRSGEQTLAVPDQSMTYTTVFHTLHLHPAGKDHKCLGAPVIATAAAAPISPVVMPAAATPAALDAQVAAFASSPLSRRAPTKFFEGSQTPPLVEPVPDKLRLRRVQSS